MTEKELFIKRTKERTKHFALDVINLCNSLVKGKPSDVITYQLVKSATSVGANYRAACRARSKNEFYSKICIVVEEADESEYWLEIIKEANITNKTDKLEKLLTEINEIVRIMNKTKHSTYSRLKSQ